MCDLIMAAGTLLAIALGFGLILAGRRLYHDLPKPVIYNAVIEDGKIDVSCVPGGSYVWVPYHTLKDE